MVDCVAMAKRSKLRQHEQSPDAPPTDTEPRFAAPDLIQIGAKACRD